MGAGCPGTLLGRPETDPESIAQPRDRPEGIKEHNDNPANALRFILRQAMDHVRPEGERRFTGEWILFNILEMKFVEGRKVREVATRLAMSEADLYRKQRVAIEEVARIILEMERQTQANINGKEVG